MRAFCPNCERITEQVFIECDDYILVDDQTVPVHLKYYVCFECDDYILVDDQFIPIHLKYYVCLECGEDYEVQALTMTRWRNSMRSWVLKLMRTEKPFLTSTTLHLISAKWIS